MWTLSIPVTDFCLKTPLFCQGLRRKRHRVCRPAVPCAFPDGRQAPPKETAIRCGYPSSPAAPSRSKAARKPWKRLGIRLPIMLKAAAGGGGRGMRRCDSEEEVIPAFNLVKGEAAKAFGDDSIFIEKFLEQPKHIEVQILADRYGNVVHLHERLLPAAPFSEGSGVHPRLFCGSEGARRPCADAVKIARRWALSTPAQWNSGDRQGTTTSSK